MPLMAAALVLLAILTLPSAPPNNEADPSLSAVLSYAHEYGLQFGTQIVSTYGPLGFLIFPCFDSHAAGLRTMVNVALCYAAAAGLCLVGWRLRVSWRCLLLGLFIWAASNIEHQTDLVIETALF